MSLQEKLDAVKADFILQIPANLRAIMDGVTDGLIASGQAENALKMGDRAPTFKLPDPDGNMVSSVDLLRKGPLVLTFYRGVWCPYCNLELQALEEVAADIRATGASLVAVSQQTAPNSRKSQRDNKLSYPILADKGGELANVFGIRWKSPEQLQSIYKQVGADLSVFNGESSWTLPTPARYVIDREGTIVYSEVNADYTRRPEPSEFLPVLRKLATALAG